MAAGAQTPTSDLDIAVLLDGAPAPYRASEVIDLWPVELFVQTEESLMRFCEDDRTRRRRPTTVRLVGSSIVLVDSDGSGRRLQTALNQMDEEGPPQASGEELEAMRYEVSDLLADLASAHISDECLTVTSALLREAGDLLLAYMCRWSGSGKWLLGELKALDAHQDTDHTNQLMQGLRVAACGDPTQMRHAVLGVLAQCGGPLFDGFRRSAPK